MNEVENKKWLVDELVEQVGLIYYIYPTIGPFVDPLDLITGKITKDSLHFINEELNKFVK